MPKILAEDERGVKDYKCELWIGIILNAFMPLSELVTGLVWVYYEAKLKINNKTADALICFA